MSFSLGEIVVLLGVASWAFGPKELPRIARTMGKLTGRATGFIHKARSNLSQFAEQTEITKVQQELQATMHQLEAIRSELRGGINILDPGPLARRAFGAIQPRGGVERTQEEPIHEVSKPHAMPGQGNTANTSFAAAGVGPTYTAPPRSPPRTMAPPFTDAFNHQHEDVGAASSSVDVIPVSAVQAGLVPDRSASTPSGSELLFDAMQEERVAQQALAFLQGNDQDPLRTAEQLPKQK